MPLTGSAEQMSSALYEFKSSPYSSHALLLGSLPQQGRGRRVLDVGCASGYLAELLARRGCVVTGIEAPGLVGPEFPAGVELIEADLDRGLPPLANRYDYILCGDVLEHLRDPLDMLRQIRRALAPGGTLLASLPNSGQAYFRWNVLLGRFPHHDRGLFDRTHLHFFTWTSWVELFAEAGFKIHARQCSGVPISLALPRFNGTAVVRALEWLSFLSARVWSKLFAYQFIVAARPEDSQ